MQGVPRVRYKDLKAGLPQDQIDSIKRAGCVIVQGGVQREVRMRKSTGKIMLTEYHRKLSAGNRQSETTQMQTLTG